MTREDFLKEFDAANQRIEKLRSWIKAANQFAWAHEKGCPHYADAGSKCTCGLDQFLSRPRPFVESYKRELDAANQRIKEYKAVSENKAVDLVRAEVALEAAERKVATARAAVAKIPFRQCDEHGCKWRVGCFSCLVLGHVQFSYVHLAFSFTRLRTLHKSTSAKNRIHR